MAAPSNPGDITILLRRVQDGDREAEKSLVSAVYNELHRMAARYMRRERVGHTLQTTALVNEASSAPASVSARSSSLPERR